MSGGVLIAVTDAKGFVTLHEPDESGKPGDLVASVWRDDWLASLSATPAPSDQDASQAQGEVRRHLAGETVCGFEVAAYRETHPEHGDQYGHTYSEHWSTPNSRDPRVKVERLFTEIQLREALASPAPGATAQDGVQGYDWLHPVDGKLPSLPDGKIHGWRTFGGKIYAGEGYPVPARRFSLDKSSCEAVLVLRTATPTPTIPAGMVADRPTYNREAVIDAFDLDQHYGPREIDSLFRAVGIMLAAAPKQAEQQGVERFVIRRNGAFFRPNAQGYTNHVIAAGFYSREEADSYANVEGVTIEPLERYRADAERTIAEAQKLIAALNAPTGAVEKGEAK